VRFSLAELHVGDQRARREGLEGVGQRCADQRGVDRHPHQADLGRREDRDRMVGMAGQHQRDPVAGREAHRQQAVGDAVHLRVDFAEGIGTALELQEDAAGVLRRLQVHRFAQGPVGDLVHFDHRGASLNQGNGRGGP
jgi:hypothetical protein